MPYKTPASALVDIRNNIDLALDFVAGLTFERFSADRKTVYAVIRCLEIISEASRRLPDDLKARHANMPWADIAGAGNIYRHDYEDLLDQMIWSTIQSRLGPLRTIAEQELARITDR